MAVQGYDVVIFKSPQSLSELFFVQLAVRAKPVHLTLFAFGQDEIEQIAVLQSVRLDLGFEISLNLKINHNMAENLNLPKVG